MKNYELTKIINNRIDHLKNEINAFPKGGGFESLRGLLDTLQKKMNELIYLIDDIEQRENI